MSTILDALKKSEQERKLNNIPTLSDLPTPDEGTRFSRGWVLALLVLLLLTGLLTLLWMGNPWLSTKEGSLLPGKKPGSAEIVLDNQTLQPASSQQQDGIVVNVVSYSAQAEQRFVIINGQLAREGEFAGAGLKVIEIKPESVILNHRGQRLEKRP